MAATSITDWCEQEGEFPARIAGGRVTRVLDVYMDGPAYRPDQVKDAVHLSGINYGSQHPTYGAFASNFAVNQQTDSRDHWRVRVEYTNEPPDEEQEDPNYQWRDPLLDPPEVEWVTKQREVAVEKDTEGDPILNYARRPYDPPPTIWLPTAVLRVTKNESAATFATLGPYIGKVNRTAWLGAPKYHVLCSDIKARKERRSMRSEENMPLFTVVFWRVTYEFDYIPEDPDDDPASLVGPFDLYKLQADYEQLNGSGDDTEPILDSTGEPVRTPWPIDEEGRAIAKDLLPGAAVYRGHSVRRTAEFHNLGITI